MKPFKNWRNPLNPLLILAIAILYFVAARIGLLFAYERSNVSLVWPPTGIALAAVLVLGRRITPAIFLGAFFANYSTNLPFLASVIVAIGNSLNAFVGGSLIRRFVGRDVLANAYSVFGFLLLGGPVASLISATIGTTAVDAVVYQGRANYLYLWLQWWLGDCVGAIIVAPLILVCFMRPPRLLVVRSREMVLLILLISVVSVMVFTASGPVPLALAYLLVPLVVAAAFRFELLGASLSLFLLSAVAIAGTSRGLGPFAMNNLYESLFMLQTFVGVVAATTLGTASVVTDRRLAQDALQLQLKDKEVLFSEIQHRVKNNLQVVCSMLSIQAAKSGPETAEGLKQAITRVRSMSMVHERLTTSGNLSDIDLGYYLRDLVSEICHSHGFSGKITTTMDPDSIFINLQKAVPCGLIVNEIITNSLKHAFPQNHESEIAVTLHRNGKTVFLDIRDNGIGVDTQHGFEAESVGMKLISVLTQQMEAQLIKETKEGTRYTLRFTS
jgi:two-component sensor histidine kinase/integral membrane sensor domain MASE1